MPYVDAEVRENIKRSAMENKLYYPDYTYTSSGNIRYKDELGKIVKYYSEPASTSTYSGLHEATYGLDRELHEATYILDRSLAKSFMESASTSATSNVFDRVYTNITATEAFNCYLKSDDVRWKKWKQDGWVTQQPAPADSIRELIRARQTPFIVTHRRVVRPTDTREFRARETLCRMIGDKAFHDYVRKGFTSVRAKSGRVYQIFPGDKMTVVWEDGKAIQNLCVDLRGGFAPTDSVIMRLILVQTDEADFWAKSNKSAVYTGANRTNQATIDFRPLPEIFAELKARAA
jgi:hypothetical protein